MNSDFTIELKTNSVEVHSVDHSCDWKVTLAYTGELTMTGGRIARAAARYLGDAEHYRGDLWRRRDRRGSRRRARLSSSHRKIGTVLGVNPPSRFGEFAWRATRLDGVRREAGVHRHWINGGYFFFRRDFEQYLSPAEDCVLEREPLVQAGPRRQARHVPAPALLGLHGHPARPRALDKLWASGKAPWAGQLEIPTRVHANQSEVKVMRSCHGSQGLYRRAPGGAAEGGRAPGRRLRPRSVRGLRLGTGCRRPTARSSGMSASLDAARPRRLRLRHAPRGDLQRPDGRPRPPDHLRRSTARLDPPGAGRQGGRRAAVPVPGSCSVYGKGEGSTSTRATRSTRSRSTPSRRSRPSKGSRRWPTAVFTPAFLRNATAYGHSPMLRIDLVVNNLLGCAVAYGEIRIKTDGTPWRPLIHCKDIARAFVAFSKRPRTRSTTSRSTSAPTRRIPGPRRRRAGPAAGPLGQVVYTGEVGNDPRNYRVNFGMLCRLLPDFRLQYNLASGMEELHRAIWSSTAFGRATSRATSSSGSAPCATAWTG